MRHENVVSIYAVDDDPTPYLVMEYIPGKTLQERLDEQGPLDLTEVLRLGKQIADGLAAAHAEQLIHRDVKPGNILLETSINDHVKITDFGLARAADDASMTQSGMIAGTPLYMAPEQALGQKLDQRADLFSLGSVLYQMLTGRPPFRARNTLAVLKRVTEDTPRPIQEVIPEIPEWMCEIVTRLHAKEPDDRYASATEVSKVLEYCLVELQQGRLPNVSAFTASTIIPARPAHLPASETSSRKSLKAMAAAALVLFFGLGITEATGVTELTSTVIRLATGSGTLVIETDDPNVTVAIDGEEVTINGAGIKELTLRPGEHQVATLKGGVPVEQHLVSITRNGRASLKISLEKATEFDSEPPLTAHIQPVLEVQNSYGLSFDGDEDYVATPIRYDGTTPLTVEATVQIDEWPNKESSEIVSDTQLGGFSLGTRKNGFYFSARFGSTYFWVESLPDNRFLKRRVKLAGVLDEESMRLYVDGKQVSQRSLPGTFTPSSQKISLGTSPGDGKPNDRYELEWKGHLFEARISNTSRYSDTYSPTVSLTSDNHTLALYRFNEGSGDQLTDVSTNGHHGRIVGAKWLKADDSTIKRTLYTWPEDAPPPAIAPFTADEAKTHQEAWAQYLGMPVEKDVILGKDHKGDDLKLTMVLIPPGEFLMGTHKPDIDDLIEQQKEKNPNENAIGLRMEGPQHFVKITKPFWLSKYEFKTGQFRRFVESSGYKTTAETDGIGGAKVVDGQPVRDPEVYWDMLKSTRGDHGPVVNVSHFDTMACCEWLSKQHPDMAFSLPTEAQWEFACRAGTTTPWYGCETADELEQYGWFNSNAKWITGGGKLKPNAFGLYDMHGNVWEWCLDWASGIYGQSPSIDPVRAEKVENNRRINRGGSFLNPANNLRSAKRHMIPPDNTFFDRGFRVAAELVPKGRKPNSSPTAVTKNYALSFDGKDDYVEILSLKPAVDSPMTIEVICRIVDLDESTLVDFGNRESSESILGTDATQWRFERSSGSKLISTRGSQGLKHEQFIHIAGVWDGSRVSLFINGVMQPGSNDTSKSRQRTQLERLIIGGLGQARGNQSAPPTECFGGVLKALRLSNTPRYSSRFTALTEFESDRQTLALYQFQSGTGDVLRDSSGNGHHGTIHGATWVQLNRSPLTNSRPESAADAPFDVE